jgi:cysteinyl-tRNA synthetase
MDFSFQGLEEAARGIERIYETLDRIARSKVANATGPADSALMELFRREMDDDFNTPRALALVFDEVRSLNRLLDDHRTENIAARSAALRQICEVLGLLEERPEEFFRRKKDRWLAQQGLTPVDMETLIAERNRARSQRNWQEADRIREELEKKGVLLEDTPNGTQWKVK